MEKPLQFPDLTPDERPWRIDWFGEVAYPSRALRFSQPSIRVALSPLLCDLNDSATLITPAATDHSAQREVWMPVGSMPMLRIGDIWQDGQRLATPNYHLESFNDVEVNPATANFIKAGLSENGDFLLPHASHPWHMHQTNSYCVCIQLDHGKRIVIPCMEIIRFYFGSSSNLISRLFTGSLDAELLWRKKTFNKLKGHLHFTLAPKLSGMSAPDIGRIALSPHAWRSAAGIHASCVKAISQNHQAYPYTGFPFEGKTTLNASGIWLPFGQTQNATFIAFNLRSCSFPFPFRSLSYESDDRSIKKKTQAPPKSQNQSGGVVRKAGISKASKWVSTESDRSDPDMSHSPHTLPVRDLPRFPDLQKKHVWRDKIKADTAMEVFLKKADGTFKRVSAGEAGRTTGGIRPIDMAVVQAETVKSSASLPKFVRIAIAELQREVGVRVELIIPAGYSKPVFPVPMIVDEDGVINESLMFTKTTKAKRRRLVCVVRITDINGKSSIKAIHEGDRVSDRPVIAGDTDLLGAICLL